MEISRTRLSEYNFMVLIDASGSMGDPHQGATRWDSAQKIAQNVADFAASVDDDGIDVITFGGIFSPSTDVFRNTTPEKVPEVFRTRRASGSTPMAEAIAQAISIYTGSGKKAFIVVVTDGIPNDPKLVASHIRDISNKLESDSDLTFLFLQIGDDYSATKFLTDLDDNLKDAKFDIVDRKTEAEYANLTFEQLFYQAQNG
jgi:Mg-chelatase subunit ChlD